MSNDKVRLLRAYGAEVVITPTNVPPDSPESYNGMADRLAREIEGAWRAGQFSNLANPRAHYESTGPEIWEQTQGRVNILVDAAGTGGTISGTGRYLKERNPRLRVIGADIEGSILSGGTPSFLKVEGIGEDFVPSTLNAQVIDEWVRVSDAESFLTARKVAREEGILLGGSSGTALAAAFNYAQRCTPDDVIAVICPDTGRNYIGKMYDDLWMAQNGFLEGKSKTRGGDGRVIPLNDKAFEILVEWRSRFKDPKPNHFVFPSERYGFAGHQSHLTGAVTVYDLDPSKPMGSWKSAWTACRKTAGVWCRLHDLRHTFISSLGDADVPESTMKAIAGWMSAKMLERYSHTRFQAKRDAVNKLPCRSPK
jgi:hypothetical protein